MHAQQAPSTATPTTEAAPLVAGKPQLVPRTHEERERRYQSLHRLILNVTVTDEARVPITGLGKENFQAD
jgi:hypothetical protein